MCDCILLACAIPNWHILHLSVIAALLHPTTKVEPLSSMIPHDLQILKDSLPFLKCSSGHWFLSVCCGFGDSPFRLTVLARWTCLAADLRWTRLDADAEWLTLVADSHNKAWESTPMAFVCVSIFAHSGSNRRYVFNVPGLKVLGSFHICSVRPFEQGECLYYDGL